MFVGNMLRGVGETPIMPLGISYLDDFSREENTPFYLGLLVYLLSFETFLMLDSLDKVYLSPFLSQLASTQ